MIHAELSRSIIGGAMTVLNTLRPGLQEKIYENALVMELLLRGHRVDQQRAFSVSYRGRFVGRLIPDLIVDNAVIIDTKAVTVFTASHISQMIGYLNITGLRLALLLNFSYASLRWKRVVR